MCLIFLVFLFFKQKTAYEMRISDWSSDVCSSDLVDIDAPALALRSSDELVAREIFARRDDHDIAPSLVEIGLAAFLDHDILLFPEAIAIGEIAVVAEQVGDDRQPARLGVEQGVFDLDRRAAEQTGRAHV